LTLMSWMPRRAGGRARAAADPAPVTPTVTCRKDRWWDAEVFQRRRPRGRRAPRCAVAAASGIRLRASLAKVS